MRKCYEILPMRILIKKLISLRFYMWKSVPREENTRNWPNTSRGIFLARNISREEYSSRGFRPNPGTNIFLTRNEKLMRNIPHEEYSSREIISRGF